MRKRHRCKNRKTRRRQEAICLSVIGCYAFTQKPEGFDPDKSGAKARLNTKQKPAGREALVKTRDQFKLAALGAMAPQTGLPNHGSPVLFMAFELAPHVKVVIRPLLFDAISQSDADHTTMLEGLRGSRKLFGVWNTRTWGIDSRQGAKHAKFGGER